METHQLLRHAILVARKLTRDADADCLAGVALHNALRLYDPARGVPIDKFVGFCVKREVRGMQRKQRKSKELLQPEEYWERVTIEVKEEDDPPDADWILLFERYIEGYKLRNLAHKYRVSVYRMEKMLAAALSRISDRVKRQSI